MYCKTLAGIFPEPKQLFKRNFLRENVREIRRMQSVCQTKVVTEGRVRIQKGKFQTTPVRSSVVLRRQVPARGASARGASSRPTKSAPKKSTDSLSSKKTSEKSLRMRRKKSQKINTEEKLEDVPEFSPESLGSNRRSERYITRGIQTEKTDNMEKFLETGVIKYPSNSKPKMNMKKSSPQLLMEKRLECGDAPLNSPICQMLDNNSAAEDLSAKINDLHISDKRHNFIRENILALRHRPIKKVTVYDPSQLPPNYPKGQLPKYLKERKEELMKEVKQLDMDCPKGHVLLPDDERKETLRVLRRSYADRIQELNSLPVRNDTLRMRRRKMEIEEELKKIDEGIKVFQRPKVYVKVNA